jgi:DNA-binding transcriptional regulator GbsR (MarR family)
MQEKQQTDRNEGRPESVMFVHQFLDEYELDPFEFRVYAHVVRRTGGKIQGEFFASLSKTAEICQISARKVQQALKFLYEAGFLDQDKRQGRTDVYKLTATKDWVKKEDLIEIRERVTGVKRAKSKKKTMSKSSSDEELSLLTVTDVEKQDLLKAVESAISPQKLHRNLFMLVLDTPSQNVKDALIVLKSQKGRVSNPSGLLTKAIKKSWTPNVS